jgi:hypothetical protein
MLKVATSREIPAKTFKIKKANARALQNLQTRQNNELSAIISLEDAKPFSNYLSEDELKKVRTIEESKKQIKQQFQMRS